ncbi:MAG: hypothetical protein AB7O24_01195 [Kofleriaceae bacterium]
MAKRIHQNDSTMEVSTSQLVADPPKTPGPRRSVPPNDASVWMQSVVSGDEFAPAPAKAKPRVRGLVVFGVLAAAALVGGGIALWRSGAKPAKPATITPALEREPVATPSAPPDAPVAPTPAPSEPAPAAAPPAVDAITGGGAAFKPADTKAAPAKPAIKKAAKPAKKRATTKKSTKRR